MNEIVIPAQPGYSVIQVSHMGSGQAYYELHPVIAWNIQSNFAWPVVVGVSPTSIENQNIYILSPNGSVHVMGFGGEWKTIAEFIEDKELEYRCGWGRNE